MYLLDHIFDARRVAVPDREVAAGATRVSKARKDDGTDDHLLPALQLSLWLVAVRHTLDNVVLPRPRIYRWGVVLGNHSANVVSLHCHDLDVLRFPALLLPHHHEVVFRL